MTAAEAPSIPAGLPVASCSECGRRGRWVLEERVVLHLGVRDEVLVVLRRCEMPPPDIAHTLPGTRVRAAS